MCYFESLLRFVICLPLLALISIGILLSQFNRVLFHLYLNLLFDFDEGDQQ